MAEDVIEPAGDVKGFILFIDAFVRAQEDPLEVVFYDIQLAGTVQKKLHIPVVVQVGEQNDEKVLQRIVSVADPCLCHEFIRDASAFLLQNVLFALIVAVKRHPGYAGFIAEIRDRDVRKALFLHQLQQGKDDIFRCVILVYFLHDTLFRFCHSLAAPPCQAVSVLIHL